MAPASGFYGLTLEKFFKGDAATTWDLEDETTVKVGLVTSSETPNFDTHNFRDDISAEVANGGGYTTGGQLLTGTDLSLSSGVMTYDATDSLWTDATITARGSFYYVVLGGASSADPLLFQLTFGGSDVVSTAGNFTIVYNASGIFVIDYVP